MSIATLPAMSTISLRIPSTLHAQLWAEADGLGVSLNHLCVVKLEQLPPDLNSWDDPRWDREHWTTTETAAAAAAIQEGVS